MNRDNGGVPGKENAEDEFYFSMNTQDDFLKGSMKKPSMTRKRESIDIDDLLG